ncbi:DUF881 domain-containing protein [Tessaracoccus sp. MC1756]|uniref:DUF881 domain-containing protein n=1 Tax=Tessaracoccus sp. MC1756 TaxID=2760311 RepID=UPI002104C974|nr:DUF881 domain-containing protein [Tessaracoccus sp. MC1756]
MELWPVLRERVSAVRTVMARNQLRSRSPRGRTTTILVCVIAGLMMTVAAIAARGTDLRSDRTADMRDLIISQSRRTEELRTQVDALQAEVNELTSRQGSGDFTSELVFAEREASMVAVTGPGIRVTLTDAPSDVRPPGVGDDALVVHQQDIQAVVNALWAGGAEAMAIQGQRVIATTGIKCVGNTVVLHGIPYAPPYVIEAIGDRTQMQAALDESPAVTVYRQYVQAYRLGYSVEGVGTLELPSFSGSTGVRFARPN